MSVGMWYVQLGMALVFAIMYLYNFKKQKQNLVSIN